MFLKKFIIYLIGTLLASVSMCGCDIIWPQKNIVKEFMNKYAKNDYNAAAKYLTEDTKEKMIKALKFSQGMKQTMTVSGLKYIIEGKTGNTCKVRMIGDLSVFMDSLEVKRKLDRVVTLVKEGWRWKLKYDGIFYAPGQEFKE